MKNIGIIETEYGKIKYELKDNQVVILEYSGRDISVLVPSKIEEKPVTKIHKKAFLSQNFVKKIYIPETIESIEDYAFARCRKLETIILPYKKINLGIDILKDCTKLSFIQNSFNYNISDLTSEDESISNIDQNDDVAFLLAKTLNELDAFFLFDLENAGSEEWIKHLDATISMRLNKDDMEDFSKMILCGEEEVVCGEDGTIEDSNPDHYKSNRVKEKIRISFLRLLHDVNIDANLREKLKSYLMDHIKGSETDETWQVVLNEHGDDRRYYDYLINIGGINADNIDLILNEMGDRFTEIKAYLIKSFDEKIKNKDDDLFSDFEL